MFVKALILYHFDLKCHIRIKTDASGYAIDEILSLLTLDNLSQWHSVVFFFGKIILAETRYKTYDSKFLAIVEIFKTWQHYLKACKYKFFFLINLNKLCHFMDIKSLSFRQVQWAHKLSFYHFCINYQ